MAKRILFFAILCIFAFSACDGSSSSKSVDDCDENSTDCEEVDNGSDDAAAE